MNNIMPHAKTVHETSSFIAVLLTGIKYVIYYLIVHLWHYMATIFRRQSW